MSDTTPPVVTIVDPTTAPTYATRYGIVAIAGTSTDLSGVASTSWKNFGTGLSGDMIPVGVWAWDAVELAIGDNLIVVTSRDLVGNEGTDSILINYDPERALTLEIHSPPRATGTLDSSARPSISLPSIVRASRTLNS